MAYFLGAERHILKNAMERVTSDYGSRTDPITGKKSTFHQGIDIVSQKYRTDSIIAFDAGTVTKIVSNITWSYADTKSLAGIPTSWYSDNNIEITHANGYKTVYKHLKHGSIKISVGTLVGRGQDIAYMGTTGYSTGNHVHFEVIKNGQYVDPTLFLKVAEKLINLLHLPQLPR